MLGFNMPGLRVLTTERGQRLVFSPVYLSQMLYTDKTHLSESEDFRGDNLVPQVARLLRRLNYLSEQDKYLGMSPSES